MSVTITSKEPCSCCGVPIECRTVSGTASYCGFLGFEDAGNGGPYWFLTSILYGTQFYTVDSMPLTTGVCDCADQIQPGATFTDYADFYGVQLDYDQTTCALTVTSNTSQKQESDCTYTVLSGCQCSGYFDIPGISGAQTAVAVAAVAQYGGCSILTTPGGVGGTQQTAGWSPTDGCTTGVNGGVSCGGAGGATQTLSNPDGGAVGRYIASHPFGPYVPIVGRSCACSEQPTTYGQTSFAFTLSEIRQSAPITGLMPFTFYQITMDVWQAVYGTTNFSLFQTIQVGEGETDENGVLTGAISDGFSIGLTPGYSEYLTNPQLVVI